MPRRVQLFKNQNIYKTRHVPLHTSLFALTEPSSGHPLELGPCTCTAGSIQQQKVKDLEFIRALLTGTPLPSPLTSYQSRSEGQGIRSSLLLEIVWVRKEVLSPRRTGKSLRLLPPPCCGLACWGKVPESRTREWGETHAKGLSGTTGPSCSEVHTVTILGHTILMILVLGGIMKN